MYIFRLLVPVVLRDHLVTTSLVARRAARPHVVPVVDTPEALGDDVVAGHEHHTILARGIQVQIGVTDEIFGALLGDPPIGLNAAVPALDGLSL